jgi:hypothetical protein
MKNILLFTVSCFLFASISYADYDTGSFDTDSADTSYEQSQSDDTNQDLGTFEPQEDRVEDNSSNPEEDASYQSGTFN